MPDPADHLTRDHGSIHRYLGDDRLIRGPHPAVVDHDHAASGDRPREPYGASSCSMHRRANGGG